MIKSILSIIYEKLLNPKKRAEHYHKKGMMIGNGCEILSWVSFGSEPYLIELGNHVKFSSGVRLITHDGGMYVLRNMGLQDVDKFGRKEIGNNVFIGIDVVIMPGVEIGDNCVIGVGSIVIKNVGTGNVVAGVPAKIVLTIDEYYKKSKEHVDFTKHMNYNQKKIYLIEKYDLKK